MQRSDDRSTGRVGLAVLFVGTVMFLGVSNFCVNEYLVSTGLNTGLRFVAVGAFGGLGGLVCWGYSRARR